MTRRVRLALIFVPSAVVAALLFSLLVYIGIPHGLHTRVYWLLGSRSCKQAVLSSTRTKTDLMHAEWQGDGWGGAPVGDWMGYVVYDPNDSLPITSTDRPPMRVLGIPCDVVAVRRLEKNWYSVVTDMNQFWDTLHPNCRSRYEQ